MNRKEIDIFLIELEKFLTNYNTYEIKLILCSIFKVTKPIGSLGKSYDIGELPILGSFINSFSPGKQDIKKNRGRYFVRRVAYNIDYKIVHDFSYEDIFRKILYNEGLLEINKNKILIDHNKDISVLPKIIIPEDWYHNDYIYLF